jgi:predicted unusual protein kinase regulating ubiquinone biosynthesis (AarF/ABC1/UbiB family)
MCEAFFRVSTLGGAADPERFRRELKSAAASWYEGEGQDVRLKKTFTLVMLDMLTLSRATRILPERDVIKYIRSAIAIDGLITRFAPSFDLCAHLGQVCDRFLKARLRQSMVSYGVMAGWMSSMDRLISDGPFRMAAVMKTAADGQLRARVDLSEASSERSALRKRAVYFGAVILAISAGVLGTRSMLHGGTVLFHAAIVLLCAALAMLVQTVFKLEKG